MGIQITGKTINAACLRAADRTARFDFNAIAEALRQFGLDLEDRRGGGGGI
jgi:hypothetical protein